MATKLATVFFLIIFKLSMVTVQIYKPISLDYYGIPQGSMLGPLFHSFYATPLLSVISKYPGVLSHFNTNKIFSFFTKTSVFLVIKS